MVDNDDTYALISKMLDFWAKALRARRIHIGMDEAHDLERGHFLDKFGYECGFELFNRRLAKVNDICVRNGFKPIIWSDMYFRLGDPGHTYYSPETVIPDDVKARIPANVQLCYWDYYHFDEEFYRDRIRRHRDLGYEPIMGSGVWTWRTMWYDHKQTERTVVPCIAACRKKNVSELFFTMWGDNGAYCEYDSSMAGLADLSYGSKGNSDTVAPLFEAVCGD